ncbi:cyclodeaminase/cyclohydrolase family protein [Burkholderia plantarii]|uniref:cyclodeaminase/cyclohydrolase family protein n=1 Tax=Burkholderia plantarii TaxID=41899 RepID=UPI000A6884A2|nr:cyclodeaminase/cyclohydrolase family protein [Burkholderia plantarii]
MDDLLPLDESLLAQPASQLLDAFGAGKASPGSGSAAAMMGLLAVKLIRTVCLKSLEKNLGHDIDAILRHILGEIGQTEPALRSLFDKDAREFEEVVQRRKEGDASADPEVKAAYRRRANDLLEIATDNTFEIIDLCLPLIHHGVTVFQYGWKAVRGDSGAAISGAIAAVTSGLFIVNLNIKGLKDRNYARNNIDRCAEQFSELQRRQVTAFSCITSLNAEVLISLGDEPPQQLSLKFPDEADS